MRKINVEGLQCTQAVMAVLREMVSMKEGEEIHISYEEPNARRDITVSYTHLRAHET